MTANETAFKTRADDTLTAILDALDDALADHVDADLNDGVLTIELDDGGQYVVNRHAPLRQIWLSSPISGAAHYAWDAESGEWRSTRGGPDLLDRLSKELSRATGVALRLAPGS